MLDDGGKTTILGIKIGIHFALALYKPQFIQNREHKMLIKKAFFVFIGVFFSLSATAMSLSQDSQEIDFKINFPLHLISTENTKQSDNVQIHAEMPDYQTFQERIVKIKS